MLELRYSVVWIATGELEKMSYFGRRRAFWHDVGDIGTFPFHTSLPFASANAPCLSDNLIADSCSIRRCKNDNEQYCPKQVSNCPCSETSTSH